ncbi:MAG: pantetheine-phosphate adenylyltransferase [Akkermansia sp.]|nr:pantetheine-phosphate adenylyltransferase [Akkermansia sp.]
MKRIAVYAGSFDPPTLGHLWMMQQGAALFDELVVVAAVNPDKKGFFTIEQHRAAMQSLLAELPPHVRMAELPQGFLAEYARSIGARWLLRGVRGGTDFEYEKTMARINAQMVPQLQTVFLTPPAELENVSSSLIRGFVGQPDWQRWVRPHVTPAVLRLMEERE